MWLMNREAGKAGSHPHASENWMKVLLPKGIQLSRLCSEYLMLAHPFPFTAAVTIPNNIQHPQCLPWATDQPERSH